MDGVDSGLGSTLSRSMFSNWIQPKQPHRELKSLRESFTDSDSENTISSSQISFTAHFHVIDIAVDYESANFIMSVESTIL